MTFLRLGGWQVAAVFASTTALVALLYLLRVRRRRVPVPFGPLWEEVLAAERRSNPLRRLRRLVSLLLQAAVVGLVALALGEPSFGGRAGRRRLVIVLDASASMAARAGGRGPTRFDEARSLARRRIIADLRRGERAMLIAAEALPRVAAPWTGSRETLLEALAALRPTAGRADLAAALDLAADAANSLPGASLLVLTDVNAPPLPPLPAGLDAGRPTVRRFGRPGENVCIAAFDARPGIADPLSTHVYLEVRSFARRRRQGRLLVYTGTRRAPVEVFPLDLAPGEVWRRSLREPLAGVPPGPLRAVLDLPDDLALDNFAYAYLPPPPAVEVELVSDTPCFFLAEALAAHPAVTVSRRGTADFHWPGPGVVPVFLGWAPAAPPAVSAVYVRPPPGRSPVRVERLLTRAVVTETDPRHPVTRRVDLAGVELASAEVLRPEEGDAVLVRSLGDALAVARRRGGRRILVLGFDPCASDLPLRAAFPVMVANALAWVRGEAPPGTRRSLAVGRPAAIPTGGPDRSASASFLSETDPPRKVPVTFLAGLARFLPQYTGFYSLPAAGGRWTVASSTVDLRESDLRPAGADSGSPGAPSATRRAAGLLPAALAPQPSLSPWEALLLGALAVMLFEWFSYHRRWTV